MKRRRRSTKKRSLSIAKDLRVESPVEVPEDVVAEILLQLPAKSLIRFRSVCKTWCDLIKSPSFIAEHSRKNRKYLILAERYSISVLSSISTESIVGGIYSHNLRSSYLEVPSPICEFTGCFLGPCNGIVCITDFLMQPVMYLCNPLLREFKLLPPPFASPILTMGMGFGFDPLTDDYKVIRIAQYSPYPCTIGADLYNLSSDSWREVDYPFPFRINGYSDGIGIFVEGACHWCAKNEFEDGILSFHMSREVFRVIGWGPVLEYKPGAWRSLVVLDGCLGVIRHYSETGSDLIYEIWMMKEYNVESSWTKQFKYAIPWELINPGPQSFFCLWTEEELLLFPRNQTEILSFNLRTKHVRTYVCSLCMLDMFNTNKCLIYKESLVSLNNCT